MSICAPLKRPLLRDERGVLGLTRCYLFRVLTFVLCDRRYHPGEPRRSQLIAVIKYTFDHPIDHDSKSRDAFTLAHAVRAVWQKNHAAWERVPGGYETFDALKGACYGLQKKQNDPFRYKQ